MNKKVNHIHRFKKINLTRNPDKLPYWVYKCLYPTCTYYIPVHLSESKICECNRCREPMLITKKVLNGSKGGALTLPHCPECTKSKIKGKKDETIDYIAQYLAKSPI